MATLSDSLSVGIKTTSDTSGVDKTESAIKQLGNSSETAGKKVSTFGDTFKAILASELVTKAISGLEQLGHEMIGFLGESINKATEYQDVVAGLDAGLLNTHQNVKLVSEALREQADAFQMTTKFTDDQILSADAMLTTFQLQGDTIKKLTPTLLDMAEGMRDETGQTISLTDAAKLMGKVMGNAEGGIDGLATALRRQGVIMTDAQKEIFKTGTETERLNTLTEIMNYNFGGRAAAAGKTYSGQMAILSHSFDDLQKSIGFALINALNPFVTKLVDWAKTDQAKQLIADIGKKVGELAQKMADWVRDVAIPWVTKHWPDIKNAVKDTFKAVGDFTKSIFDFSNWVTANEAWLEPIIGSLVLLKAGLMLSSAIAVVQGAFTTLTLVTIPAADLAFSTFAMTVAAPLIMPAIAIGAALFAIQQVWNAYNDMQNAIQGAKVAAQNLINIREQAVPRMLEIYNNGVSSPAQKANAQQFLHNAGVQGFASGTDFAPGGLSLVGEQGPELVNLPRGSQVFTNNQTKQMMSSNSSTVIHNVNLNSASAVQEFFKNIDQDNLLVSKGLTPNRGRA